MGSAAGVVPEVVATVAALVEEEAADLEAVAAVVMAVGKSRTSPCTSLPPDPTSGMHFQCQRTSSYPHHGNQTDVWLPMMLIFVLHRATTAANAATRADRRVPVLQLVAYSLSRLHTAGRDAAQCSNLWPCATLYSTLVPT